MAPKPAMSRHDAPFSCELCGVVVPSNSWQSHRRGAKHLSMLFYGDKRRTLLPIIVPHVPGPTSTMVSRRVPAADVPERVVATARRARELVLKGLVAHSGVALFDRAQAPFSPERICAVQLWLADMREALECSGLEQPNPLTVDTHSRFRLSDGFARTQLTALDAAQVARLVASLSEQRHAPVDVEVRLAPVDDEIMEICLSCALHTLVGLLPTLAPGSTLHLALGQSLRLRRFGSLLVQRLGVSVAQARGLRSVHLSAEGGHALREADAEGLEAAARDRWRETLAAVLLGSHPRVGACSPLRMLPSALLQGIVEQVAEACRTHVHFSLLPSAAAPVPSGATHQPGADLGLVAQFAAGL